MGGNKRRDTHYIIIYFYLRLLFFQPFDWIRNSIHFPMFICLFECYISNTYIYILIALALDESIILDVLQFPMQNINQSCDLGRAIGLRNVNASQ